MATTAEKGVSRHTTDDVNAFERRFDPAVRPRDLRDLTVLPSDSETIGVRNDSAGTLQTVLDINGFSR